MKRLLLFFAEKPWLALGLLLIGSILAATRLGDVKVKVSADEMMVADDPQRAYYEAVRETFGEENLVLFVVEDPDLLAADKLTRLRGALDKIEALPFVARSESLFNVPHVRSVDGYLKKDPYLAVLPDSPEAADALYAAATSNPLIRNVLVSTVSRAMAIAIVLDDRASPVEDEQLVASLQQIITPLEQVFSRVYAIGFPQVRQEIAERIMAEQTMLMPLAIAALLIALFLLLRQLLDILTPLITAGISILWTFGLMGWLGIPINVVTSTVPILLIVVGSTEDIHLLAEFRHAQRRGDTVALALKHMARKMGRTVLLTFLTTCAGFFSVGLSGIEILTQFGLIASVGLLFNFIATVIFIPAALSLGGHWRLDGRSRLFDDRPPRWSGKYWRFLVAHRLHAFVLLVLAAGVAATGIPRIQINHNPADSLGSHSEVAKDMTHLNAGFAGLESFAVVLNSGIQDTFLNSRYLNELYQLQTFIRSLDESMSVTSFADYLVLLNEAFLESDSAGLPASNDEIAELMIFLDHQRVQSYVTEDYSQARITVRHQITDNRRLKETLSKIQHYLDERLDKGLQAKITGDSILTLSATRSMIAGQLQSVLLILTFFILIVAFIFTDLRVGLLAALPNIFPVVILFGVMGFAGIPLNIGTTMAAAIAIGIAVDGTLHLMLRYNQALKNSTSQSQAMQQTLHEEALPVISTSVALTAGFLVFAQSGFEPVAQFGMLSALVISTALLADFVITPLAISALRLITLWDLLSARARSEIIPSSPLFRGMRPWQIRKFVLSSTLVDYPAGEFIYRKHDDSYALFLVMKGIVEIRVPSSTNDDSGPMVNQFVAGQVFGDVALLAEEPRKTNAIALSNVTVIELTREAISNVTLFHPFVASRLFLNLARDVSCRWVSYISKVRNEPGRISKEDEAS